MVLSISIIVPLSSTQNKYPWYLIYLYYWQLEYGQLDLANRVLVPGFELEVSESKKQDDREFIWVGISSIQMYILGAVWTVVPVASVWGQQWQLPRPQQRNNSMTFTVLGWPAFCSFCLFSGCVFPNSLEIPWAVRYLFNKFLFYLN